MSGVKAVNDSQWRLSLAELVEAVSGREISHKQNQFFGIGTDTRVELHGQIFIALRGENFDAHDFLKQAVDKGAACLVVDRLPDKSLGERVTIVEVDDTLKALQHLARFWRRKMPAKILGVTGTNGKTTTKEFAAAIIGSQRSVQYSKGSFNNHWGVPLSLLSIMPSHEVAVIEMGMNHLGELRELSKIAEPDVVLCTMVGRGHLEGVGSIEGVARAKAEIYEFAPAQATMVFNLANEYTRKMYANWRERLPLDRQITFAEADDSRAMKADVQLVVEEVEIDTLKIRGVIRGLEGVTKVPVFGKQNVTNLMAAAAFALAAGLTPAQIWQALPACRTGWGRNQWVDVQSGARVLFDGYNANPESMQAAIENFSALRPSGKKIAILGEMRELGVETANLHRELGERVARAGFSHVLFVGPSFTEFKAGMATHYDEKNLVLSDSYQQTLAAAIGSMLNPDDLVLIKGSRGMQLERILQDLKPVGFQAKT